MNRAAKPLITPPVSELVKTYRPTLVTGAAGFIGYHVVLRLLQLGRNVVGLDNFNDYYDPALKRARVADLQQRFGFRCGNVDICNEVGLEAVFESKPAVVIHLAAQAGVRFSISNPEAYVRSNVDGFFRVLEACRRFSPDHLVYASSSSVYGNESQTPFNTLMRADAPVSLYAATKRSNELFAHTYSHLYGIPASGLRLFTVYGPWGRPDMAYFRFTRAILRGEPIDVFNRGALSRDFTYVDDVVDAILAVAARPPLPSGSGVAGFAAPHRVLNVGRGAPTALIDFIRQLELLLDREAVLRMVPMQDGDVLATYADVSALRSEFGVDPATSLSEGLSRFVDWYKSHMIEGSESPNP